MVLLNRIREWKDNTEPTKRYADDDELNEPEETIDPHTWDDPHSTTWRERIYRRRRSIFAVSLLGFVILSLISIYARRYFIDLLADPLVQEVVKIGGIATLAGIAGMRHGIHRVQQTDELVLFIGETVRRYEGEYAEDDTGNPVFLPYSGHSSVFHSPRKLTLADMGDEHHRTHAKYGREPDDPARIDVRNALHGVAQTDAGTVCAAMTDGLVPDPWGKGADIRALPPDVASPEHYRRLSNQVEHLLDTEIPSLRKESRTWRDQYDQLLSDLQQSRGETIEEFAKRVETMADAFEREPEVIETNPFEYLNRDEP